MQVVLIFAAIWVIFLVLTAGKYFVCRAGLVFFA